MKVRELFLLVADDLKQDKRLGALNLVERAFFDLSFRLTLNYRLRRFFNIRGGRFSRIIEKYLKKKQLKHYSCLISSDAIIGRHVRFPHPTGIVIGGGVQIGNFVDVYQHVTIGSHGKKGLDMAYPIIEDNAKIFAGSTVIGGIVVGKKSVIGANSVVAINVPADGIAVGSPARVLDASKSL